MKTLIKRFCDTLALAEREQNSLYNRFDYVRLVQSPMFSESGYYTWEVRK